MMPTTNTPNESLSSWGRACRLALVLAGLAGCGDGAPAASAARVTAPLSVSVPTDEIIDPGTGYFTPDPQLRARCVTGEISKISYPSSEVVYQSDVGVDDLLTTFTGSASFSVKAGKFRASAAAQFATSSASSKRTINMVLMARYVVSHDVLDPASAHMLETPGTLGGEQAFTDLCGDEVVTEAVRGGLIGISVVITAASETDASALRAAVQARAWKVSTMSEIFKTLAQADAKYTVEIHGTQMGGDADQLGQIIGGGGEADAEAVRDCSGGDVVDACQTVLAKAIEYGSSPDRAAEMAASPITLSVNTTPWKYFLPIADLNVSADVLIARGRLSLLASQNLDCQKDDPDLALYCSTVNAAILQAAGELCFNKAVDEASNQACVTASQDPWLQSKGFMLPAANASTTTTALNCPSDWTLVPRDALRMGPDDASGAGLRADYSDGTVVLGEGPIWFGPHASGDGPSWYPADRMADDTAPALWRTIWATGGETVTGYLIGPKTGAVELSVGSDDYSSIQLDNLFSSVGDNTGGVSGMVQLQAGKPYKISIAYQNRGGSNGFTFSWRCPQ